MTDGDLLLLVLIGACLMADTHAAARAAVAAMQVRGRRWLLWLTLRLAGIGVAWAAVVYLVKHHGG